MDDARIDALLAEHLAQLPDDHREVLTLHYFAGNDTREIARILGISRDAAKKRLQRSRDLLGANLLPALQAEAAQGRLSEERLQRLVRTVIAVPVPWLAVAASASAVSATALAAAGLGASVIIAAAAAWWFAAGDATPAPSPVEPPMIVEASTGWTLREPSAAAPSAAPSSAMAIAGRVVDGTTNQPIASFLIRALHESFDSQFLRPEDAITFNDANGAFDLPIDAPGTYALLVEADGYYRYILPGIALGPGEQKADMLIPLKPGRIHRGIVVDMDGNGVSGFQIEEGIRIDRRHTTRIAAVTDSRGRFTVAASSEGWTPNFYFKGDYNLHDEFLDGDTVTYIVYKGGIVEATSRAAGSRSPTVCST